MGLGTSAYNYMIWQLNFNTYHIISCGIFSAIAAVFLDKFEALPGNYFQPREANLACWII